MKTPLSKSEVVQQRLVRPCCANCRWGSELEHRYDQVYCINEDSQEAFGDVEATHSCPLFEKGTPV